MMSFYVDSNRKDLKGGTQFNFQNFCKIKWLGCKQSHLEWFGVKCSVLEKLLRIVHSGGDRNQMPPLKAPSQNVITLNGYEYTA